MLITLLYTDRKQLCSDRELRRRTYTVTESDIQSAIALIPSHTNAVISPAQDLESNIDISGDEDDFDDVFMFENGELFKEDVEAILAALRQANEEALESTPIDLPEPPSCFADNSVSKEKSPETDIKINSQKPVVSRGPRIMKPTEKIEPEPIPVKVIRGHRKPLYPGKRITNIAPSAGNKVVKNNDTPTRGTPPPPPTGRSSKIATVTRNSSVGVNKSSSESRPSKLRTKNVTKTNVVSGKPTNGTNRLRPKPVNTKNLAANVREPSLVSKDSNNVHRMGVTLSSSTLSDEHMEKHPGNRNNNCSSAGDAEPKGRIVSPGSVLRRAADSSKGGYSSSTNGKILTTDCRSKAPCHVPQRDTHPRATSRSHTNKPQAVSKIAGLWKTGAAATNRKPSPGTKATLSSKNSNNLKKRAPTTKKEVDLQDYVVAISFREPAHGRVTENQNTHLITAEIHEQKEIVSSEGCDKTKRENNAKSETKSSPAFALLTSSDITTGNSAANTNAINAVATDTENGIEPSMINDAATITESSTTSDIDSGDSIASNANAAVESDILPNNIVSSPSSRKLEKSSAIVSPFLYKPQKSKNFDRYSNSAETLTADFTSQTSFYGQENKITVHLDIKPCITVSDVTPGQQPVIELAHARSHSLGGEMKNGAPITKTEMLLRRRTEILNRRKDSNSTARPRQASKTTDV